MYSKILVPVDGSHTGKLGLNEAIRLAKSQKTPARLHIVHVVDDFPMLVEMASVVSFDRAMEALHKNGQAILDQSKRLAAADGLEADVVLRQVIGSRISRELIAEVQRAGCDLIVMGTHGRRGLTRLAMGSDADMIVASSPVPVLLVRGAATHAQAPEA